MRSKIQKTAIPLAFWLAVWAAAAALVGREMILPGPGAVIRATILLAAEPHFWKSAVLSLLRVGLGFFLGVVLGTALGALTAASRWCDLLLSPALRAVRTVPVVSFILLLYFSLGTAWVPVAVAGLMALPVVWRAARQGIAAADPRLLELAAHYGLGRWKTIRLVYLPACMPALAAGWETALGLAWKSGVAAEVLTQPKWAVGTQLQAAKMLLDTASLVGWTVVIVLLSVACERLLRLALRRWKGANL